MKSYKSLLLSVLMIMACTSTMTAKPMKARTIQPLFAMDAKGLDESFQWTLDVLAACDPSLDIIVLPEFSEVPGKTKNEDFIKYVRQNGKILLDACAETAKRCNALVFCGAIELTEYGPRNTLYVFDRQGKVVGKYLKEHLTRGEWANLGFDKSYTQKWNAPYTLEIEGLKYAFLTCYDFYFYENYSNIARTNPDIIIGSSHQRSDTHRALDIIDTFCAYNTGAYLVRASVSMGVDSPLGGCSCVVAPTGEILGDMYSKVGVLDVTFDPEAKYLKPAGYGNPPAKHSQYIEIGRRPWKYRPGGSAIVLPLHESADKRICAMKGYASIKDDLLAAYGAAVAVGASEIGVSIRNDADVDLLEQVLAKLSCHTLMNIQVRTSDSALISKVCRLVDDYDAVDYVYFTSSDASALAALAVVMPKIPRCMALSSNAFDSDLIKNSGCSMVQVDAAVFDAKFAERMHQLGVRCNVVCPDKAKAATELMNDGADTIIAGDYLLVAKATGLK